MVGLLLGSRELLCLTLFVWSDLENPREVQLVIRARLAGGVRELSNAGGMRARHGVLVSELRN
jgi:hypothetical protein